MPKKVEIDNNDLPGFYEWLREKAKQEAEKKAFEPIPLELTLDIPAPPSSNKPGDKDAVLNFEIDINEVDHSITDDNILKF